MRIQDKNKKRMSKPGGGSSQPPNIHESVESGDLIGVQRLLSQDPSLLNQKSDDTALETPLHVSAGNNRIEISKYFLEWKGQGDQLELEAQNAYGETPLHVAAKNGYTETVRILLQNGANIEARNNSSMTPLHLAVGYALRSGENSVVKTLLDFNADISATDEEGMTPSNYLPMSLLQDDELLQILSQNAAATTTHDAEGNNTSSRCGNFGAQNDNNNNGTAYFSTENGCDVIKTGMDEFENELSNLVGQHELKSQLRKWAKGFLLDEKRRAMGLDLGPRKRPHIAFLGNPGTGMTTIARILGRLLRSIGVLLSDKVTKVKSLDLIGENLVRNAKRKIEEATGGILLVNEAYLILAREQKEALQEIMSASDNADLVVIFSGYADPMKRAFGSNPEFRMVVTATNSFEFNDFSCSDLAEMVTLKMNKQDEKSRLCGLKLHSACTHEALVSIIEKNSTEKLRSRLNGRLVDRALNNARENLDSRLTLDSRGDELLTITLMDLEVGIIRALGEMVDVA